MRITHKPQMIRIKEVVDETKTVKTFILDKEVDATPGQFAMLWIPDEGEKPFSFSKIGADAAVTVRKVGNFTEKMHTLGSGDQIGFRGPYGNGFKVQGKDVIIVAGGCGAAPLLPLVSALDAKDITIIVGAATKTELLFLKEYGEYGQVLTATDDGSSGQKGTAVDVLGEVLVLKKPDQIFGCGPEKMLAQIMDISLNDGIACQLSLERYMKCGMGLCGSCFIDNMRVCKEGPIFDVKDLRGTEFGSTTRDASGSNLSL